MGDASSDVHKPSTSLCRHRVMLVLVGSNIWAYGQALTEDSNLLLQCAWQRVRVVGPAVLLFYEHSEIVCLSVLIMSSLPLKIPATRVFYSKRSTYILVSRLFARIVQ